ncbi:MAG: multidrug effflux MFS transporter [Chlamydiae bacterium]|nr:multidrug effflux MFS transporter [Chlamydiota bacterium]
MSRKLEIKYLFLLIVIYIAACIETDIYLPAFPDMMSWFSASEGSIQNLLTWNFIGICIAGPLYGPISDAVGRKKPLFIALGLFFLGSLITIFAQTINQMLLGRVLQGLGSGGCFTLGTAILFDAFQKEKAIRALNQLNLIIPLIMAMAPMLGAYLNLTYGFRSNFLTIALFVFASLVISIAFFEETHPKEKRTPLKITSILLDFKKAFSSKPFWQLTLVMCILFSAYISFLSGSAILFVVEFNMSKAVFPFVQGAILGGWVIGSLTLEKAIKKWGVFSIKKAGIALSALFGLTAVAFALLFPKNPYLLTAAMTFYAFGANWVIGLYFPEGMEILPDIKGITSSLMTSARLLVASITVSLVGYTYNGTIYPLAIVIGLTIAIILPTLYLYEKSAGKNSISAN